MLYNQSGLGRENMAILFLLFNVILFSSSLVAIFLLLVFLIMKKYNLVGYILNTMFIAMLVLIMFMSWNIVFMNLTYGLHPFEVNYYISGNYDIAIIFFVFYVHCGMDYIRQRCLQP